MWLRRALLLLLLLHAASVAPCCCCAGQRVLAVVMMVGLKLASRRGEAQNGHRCCNSWQEAMMWSTAASRVVDSLHANLMAEWGLLRE